MLLKYSVTFLILHTCFVYMFSDETTVTISSGKIKGRVAKTFKNTTFYAFQEIPYAAPPLGSLRFKPPSPVESWDGVLETTKNTKICIQAGGGSLLQNEDCLYLNVYTPLEPNTDQRLPVLFFIHGGMFLYGNGAYDEHGPDFFIDTQKVVVVTTNYRLGPFGFLSTADDIIPGNNALKDQRLALKWVQENINLFGGDSTQVTIVGQSAGSASVSYHVLSKQSKGLFRAAVCESGTVLTPWSYQRYAKDIAYQTAAAIDSSFSKSNTSEELLKLLQEVSADDLQSAANTATVPTKHVNYGFVFGPVLESGDDGFVTEFSYEVLEKGEFNIVPMIVGMNSEEAITQIDDPDTFKKLMTTYDNDLTILVNDDFHIENQTVQLTVGEKIRKIFTDGLLQDDLASSVRFVSDSRYSVNIIKYGHLLSHFTEVYFYQFAYDGELGNVDSYIEGAESVAHSEELEYMWRNERNDDIDKFPETDVLTHKRLVKLWTNFVTNLKPIIEDDDLLENITWPQLTPEKFQYLDIREELKIKTDPKGEVFKSWTSIFDEYAVRPFDTY